jgi:hypothetical protein
MWVSTFEHTSEYGYPIVLKAWCLLVIIGSKADFWLVSGDGTLHHASVGWLLSFDLIINQVINPVINNLPG